MSQANQFHPKIDAPIASDGPMQSQQRLDGEITESGGSGIMRHEMLRQQEQQQQQQFQQGPTKTLWRGFLD